MKSFHLPIIILLGVFFISTKNNAQVGKTDFPKPKNGNAYLIAHREVHHTIPENTQAAYQKAIDIGCDFVEFDLRMTKDGSYVKPAQQNGVEVFVDNDKATVGT